MFISKGRGHNNIYFEGDILYRKSMTFKDTDWKCALPKIELPFIGESLFGYLLRLDFINGFAPGSIIKNILTTEQFSFLIKSYDMEYFEEVINISELSKLTGLPIEDIDKFRISYVRKKIFGSDDKFTKESLKYSWLKICPVCIANWRIPQLFFFSEVNICPIHGLKLLGRCECFKKIDILAKANPFLCKMKNCNREYTNICESSPKDIKHQFSISSILSSYFYHDMTLALKYENIKEELQKKVSFLIEIRNAAMRQVEKAILTTSYFFKPAYLYEYYFKNKFDLIALVSILIDYDLSPYQFMNINILEDKIIKTYISEIGISQDVEAGSKIVEGSKNNDDIFINHLHNSMDNLYKKAIKEVNTTNDYFRILIKGLVVQDLPFTIKGKVNVETSNFTVSLDFSVSDFLNGNSSLFVNI